MTAQGIGWRERLEGQNSNLVARSVERLVASVARKIPRLDTSCENVLSNGRHRMRLSTKRELKLRRRIISNRQRYWAVQSGHEAVVQLLLEKGANVEAKSNNGWMALHEAANEGHEAVVKLL
jgi:hypothetical protein